jgi:DNA-binding transcriptional MerR regulator
MMQLDLLGKEVASATSETPLAPAKKTMTPHSEPSDDKSPSAFKTISEAADALGVPQHVLRFWEGRFAQIKPLKLRGGRRYYRPEDMEILTTIKNLLYKQGYTIKGARKVFGARKPVEPVMETPAPKKALDEKQQSQLAVIRQELIGLRDILKPHVF